MSFHTKELSDFEKTVKSKETGDNQVAGTIQCVEERNTVWLSINNAKEKIIPVSSSVSDGVKKKGSYGHAINITKPSLSFEVISSEHLNLVLNV